MEELKNLLSSLDSEVKKQSLYGNCCKCGKTIVFLQGHRNICPECEKAEKTKNMWLERINYIIPAGYRHMSFSNLIKTDVVNLDKAIQVCKSFVYDDTGVYIWGNSGIGKTHLLIATMRECIMHSKSCAFMRYSLELKNYKDFKYDRDFFYDKFSKCEYLFIDDFGSVGTRDDGNDVLFGILQRRIENKKGKKIFVTSNIPLTSISDDRVKSRISGMCVGYKVHSESDTDTEKYINIVELKGKDMRLSGRV